MNYRLKIAEDTVDLDVIRSDAQEVIQMTTEGKSYHVRVQAISDNHFHLVVDGTATEAYVAQDDQGKFVVVNGRSFFVQDADQLNLRRSKRRTPEETPGEVTPPMPSVVVRILVKEGDYVKKGQGLVVVTAMKMETTLTAPTEGRVKKINKSINAKVAPGDILVEIEDEEKKDE